MRAFFLSAALLVLAVPAVAHASGGGLSATYGGEGAKAPGNPSSYVALPDGRNSVIQELRDGGVVRWKPIKGRYGVPQVALDGTKTGLAANGQTLVLGEIPDSYPIRETNLLVLDARSLRIDQRIHLRGWYSVDGTSLDGSVLYLVHYTKPTRDPSAYEVVGYDRKTGEQRVIMDPDEPDEEMSGQPVARVSDGIVEYTLYDNPEEPFVHALDTGAGTAECIDLPQLKGQDLYSLPLRLDGDALRIGGVVIDTTTKAVATPTPHATATPAAAQAEDEGGTSPWPFVLGGFGVLALAAFAVSRRSMHSVEDLELAVHVPDEEPALRK